MESAEAEYQELSEAEGSSTNFNCVPLSLKQGPHVMGVFGPTRLRYVPGDIKRETDCTSPGRQSLPCHLHIEKDKVCKRGGFREHRITIIRVTFHISAIYSSVNLSTASPSTECVAMKLRWLPHLKGSSRLQLQIGGYSEKKGKISQENKAGPSNVLVRNKAIMNII